MPKRQINAIAAMLIQYISLVTCYLLPCEVQCLQVAIVDIFGSAKQFLLKESLNIVLLSIRH